MIWKIATLLLLISIGAKADDDYYDSDDGHEYDQDSDGDCEYHRCYDYENG